MLHAILDTCITETTNVFIIYPSSNVLRNVLGYVLNLCNQHILYLCYAYYVIYLPNLAVCEDYFPIV